MAFGAEAHTGFLRYEVVLTHNPSGNSANITFEPFRNDGTTPTEAQRDQIFQAFLSKLGELANVTINSATKKGEFATPVTPA